MSKVVTKMRKRRKKKTILNKQTRNKIKSKNKKISKHLNHIRKWRINQKEINKSEFYKN